VSSLTRSWAPRGQTPRQRSVLNHKLRLSLLGALIVSPSGQRVRLQVGTVRGNVDGLRVLAFLRRLLRRQRGPILLLWDSAGIHLRRAVLDFITDHPRLELIVFPKYAPELNPVEFGWTQVSTYLAGRAPRDLPALRVLLQAAIRRLRPHPWRLRACLRATPLCWRGTPVA
jgi:transposase